MKVTKTDPYGLVGVAFTRNPISGELGYIKARKNSYSPDVSGIQPAIRY
ncbi:hypothetical protein PQG02_21785 [Nostoc sp. UHCC 0926]|nr:hypothetical protein PQG02_21785 [Nostoc sp. UHCC 0926]